MSEIIDVNPEDIETENQTDLSDDNITYTQETGESNSEKLTPENIDFDALLKKKRFSLFLKRTFDIFASFFGLLVLSPILILIALLIVLTSSGGVFFRQVRVGRNGKEFRIFKFRTMVKDAEAKGMQITVGNDSRVTTIGKILRKCKLDELPQLINVLLGQMSFVGYRPEVPKYVAMYTVYQRNILRIRPGITDLASIEYRDENEVLEQSDNPEDTYVNDVMQKKLALNIKYMQEMGFWYDLKLIFKTFLAILK